MAESGLKGIKAVPAIARRGSFRAAAGRTVLPGEEAALADLEDTTHPADREAGHLRLDEAEGQPWRVHSNQWRSPATSLSREEGRGLGCRRGRGGRKACTADRIALRCMIWIKAHMRGDA